VEQRSRPVDWYFEEAASNPYRYGSDTGTRGFTLTKKDRAGRVVEVTAYAGQLASNRPWTGTSMGTTVTSHNGERCGRWISAA